MARGFESKSVESQQAEERQAHGRPAGDEGQAREELEHTRHRESIESSLRGLRRELENARSPILRTALENALRHLENELRKLD